MCFLWSATLAVVRSVDQCKLGMFLLHHSKGVKYCDQHICLCLVCSHTIVQIFCRPTCDLWLWLGPPLIAVQYVTYVRICGKCAIISQTVRDSLIVSIKFE